jgi:hypothetical protein
MILGISAGDHFLCPYSPLPRIVRATPAVLLRGALLRRAMLRGALLRGAHCRPAAILSRQALSARGRCRLVLPPVSVAGWPGMHFPPGRADMA